MAVNYMYFTQVGLSLIMMAFCITMISIDNTSDSRAVYLPILTSIVGVWLPQPKNKGDEPSSDQRLPLLPT